MGCSTREIDLRWRIAWNTARRYLKTPEPVKPKSRQSRGSKLDPYLENVDRRMAEWLETWEVLCRELQGLGYQ